MKAWERERERGKAGEMGYSEVRVMMMMISS